MRNAYSTCPLLFSQGSKGIWPIGGKNWKCSPDFNLCDRRDLDVFISKYPVL